jgi:hypothetical protein
LIAKRTIGQYSKRDLLALYDMIANAPNYFLKHPRVDEESPISKDTRIRELEQLASSHNLSETALEVLRVCLGVTSDDIPGLWRSIGAENVNDTVVVPKDDILAVLENIDVSNS